MTFPTMQLEDDNLILKFDQGGLVIIRKQTQPGDPWNQIVLTAREASSFTRMWGMANGAIQVAAMGMGTMGLVISAPEEWDNQEETDQ